MSLLCARACAPQEQTDNETGMRDIAREYPTPACSVHVRVCASLSSAIVVAKSTSGNKYFWIDLTLPLSPFMHVCFQPPSLEVFDFRSSPCCTRAFRSPVFC